MHKHEETKSCCHQPAQTGTETQAAEGFEADEVLALAAALERLSEHPLATAIVAGAKL